MGLGQQFGRASGLSAEDVDQPAVWQIRTGTASPKSKARGAYYEMAAGDDEGASGEASDGGVTAAATDAGSDGTP